MILILFLIEMLYYAYPISNVVSFTHIAKNHIKYLRKKYNVIELDCDFLNSEIIKDNGVLCIHPFLYPFMTKISNGKDELEKILNRKVKVIGFDTADTDRISQTGISLVNKLNLLIVPSDFAKNVYRKSGAYINIEVLPHAIPDTFLDDNKDITSPFIKNLLKEKVLNNYIYIFFDLRHSGFRKGADFVYNVIRRVQWKYNNAILLIKRGRGEDLYLKLLKNLKNIDVAKDMPEDEYRQLFDICDIALNCSRGGGFEVQVIEAISRGDPTLVPKNPFSSSYIDYAIGVEIDKPVKVFNDNPIHIGMGWDININDLENKLLEVLHNLDYYKEKFKENAKKVRKIFNWDNIGNQLLKII